MKQILTLEQVAEKAAELGKAQGVPVLSICFNLDKDGIQTKEPANVVDQIVGYIKEPSRQAKIVAFGKMQTEEPNITDMGMVILEAGLLKEESDPRLYSLNQSDDNYVISAANAAAKLVRLYSNEVKKN